MSRKRDILDQLKREELVAAVVHFDLPVADRRAKSPLIEALAASRKVGLPAILEDLPRTRLKDLCRALGLNDSGREKAVLIARLAGDSPAPPPPAARTVAIAAPASRVTRQEAAPPTPKPSEGKRLPLFEQAFRNIDDVLRKEAGCTTELDYTEQTSWLLFLKYLDGLDDERATEAQLEGKKYTFILDEPYRWETWAAPKTKNGQIDHNRAMTGDDLRDFVNLKLFPYLHGFKQKASGPNTIEYKIGEIESQPEPLDGGGQSPLLGHD